MLKVCCPRPTLLFSGCDAEVATAAHPLLQAVVGALAELSKLLHILRMHRGKTMLLLLMATQLSSKAAASLCCRTHWLSLALAKAGCRPGSDAAATSYSALAESCMFRES